MLFAVFIFFAWYLSYLSSLSVFTLCKLLLPISSYFLTSLSSFFLLACSSPGLLLLYRPNIDPAASINRHAGRRRYLAFHYELLTPSACTEHRIVTSRRYDIGVGTVAEVKELEYLRGVAVRFYRTRFDRFLSF